MRQFMNDQQGIIIQNSSNLANIFNEMDKTSFYLACDQVIPAILSQENATQVALTNARTLMNSQFSHYTNFPITASSIVYETTLYVSDKFSVASQFGRVYPGGKRDSSSVVANSLYVMDQPWYRMAMNNDGLPYSFLLESSPASVFFSKRCRNQYLATTSYGNEIGVVVYGIKIKEIRRILQNGTLTDNTKMFLLYENAVLYSNVQGAAGQQIEQLEDYGVLAGTRCNSQFSEMSVGGVDSYIIGAKMLNKWKLITLIPRSDVISNLNGMIALIAIESALVLLLGVGMAVLLTIMFTKPVIRLAGAMQSLQHGELPANVLRTGVKDDEIGILYHSYNNMVDHITQLVKDIRESSMREKESKMLMLQAQINPHFVCNTLDSINWIAMCEGQSNISVMVTSLAEVLQYTVKNPDEVVTLREEIFHIERYLKIQRLRYADKFIVENLIPEPLLACQLPKLTIQPLVENSITHAAQELGSIIRIKFSGFLDEDGIRLIVSDNGRRADPDEINAYLRGEDTLKPTGNGLGIRNIDERLRLHFSPACSLTYHRTDDGGLAAVILLPAESLPGRIPGMS